MCERTHVVGIGSCSHLGLRKSLSYALCMHNVLIYPLVHARGVSCFSELLVPKSEWESLMEFVEAQNTESLPDESKQCVSFVIRHSDCDGCSSHYDAIVAGTPMSSPPATLPQKRGNHHLSSTKDGSSRGVKKARKLPVAEVSLFHPACLLLGLSVKSFHSALSLG